MSVECGPCQDPQQQWKRTSSRGIPRSAWFSASTRTIVNFRYSSSDGSVANWSQFSAKDGSSIWTMMPAFVIARYSSRIASAHAQTNSSSVA